MSPEDQRVWEEDAETEYAEAHAQARPATHSPADAEKVSQDVGEVERARVARYAEAIYDGGSVRCGLCGFTKWRDCLLCADWCEAAARDAIRLADSELASVVVENKRLRRWKAEAIEVTLGLQDLGRALGLPLGENITGRAATEAVHRLTARAGSAEAEVKRLRVCDRGRLADLKQANLWSWECLARAEAAEAEVERLRAESVESSSLYAQWRDDCAAEVERLRVRLAAVVTLANEWEQKAQQQWPGITHPAIPVEIIRAAALADAPTEQPCRACLATGFVLVGGECQGCASRGWCDDPDPRGGRACHLRSGHAGLHTGGRHSWPAGEPAEQRAEGGA